MYSDYRMVLAQRFFYFLFSVIPLEKGIQIFLTRFFTGTVHFLPSEDGTLKVLRSSMYSLLTRLRGNDRGALDPRPPQADEDDRLGR